MYTRTIERICIGVVLLLFFVMLMYTNGSVRTIQRVENGKYSHLDHRITALRHRVDKKEDIVEKPVEEEEKASAASDSADESAATPPSEPIPFDEFSSFASLQ